MSPSARPQISPERLMQFTFGFALPLMIETAIRYGVFDILEKEAKTLDAGRDWPIWTYWWDDKGRSRRARSNRFSRAQRWRGATLADTRRNGRRDRAGACRPCIRAEPYERLHGSAILTRRPLTD
jgi:hypothetical protein